MKDPIIESYLKDFSLEHKKSHLAEPEQFEHFINYCVMAKHYTEVFDPDDVSIGGGGDLGIDGIGIFVNDHLVLDESAVDFLKKSLRRLDVEFVFVQSKTSASFDGGDIGTFLSGVRNFFEQTLPNTANADIRQAHALKQYIYSLTIDMDRPPVCHMYYATTGVWKNEAALNARIDQVKDDLKHSRLFDLVEFSALDAEKIKRVYREIKHKFVRELSFEKHTILPEIAGVSEAYIGVVPAKEYLKILCDDDGILNRRLFYDNVRDFQGHNSVNSEIRATILENQQSDRFSLLNNGVTVVAKDVNKVGAKFRLRDYQVVNGCQTSHVIYLAKEHLSENMYLPLKLIITNDLDITNQIIQGANRQTEIKPEAFESLAPFQKELEETYLAVSKSLSDQVFYERRSKQYDEAPVSRDHIVTLPAQIKCFVGMFLNEPHSTHRYYGELLDSYRTRIFSESHRLMPYVTSGVALAAMEKLFTEERIPRSLRWARFQLLMAFRLRFGEGEMPTLNAKRMDDYCAKLLAIINIPEAYKKALQEVGEVIERTRDTAKPWREPPERTRSFTSDIVAQLSSTVALSAPAHASRSNGEVISYSAVKGFGFIKASDGGDNIFFHHSELQLEEGSGLKKSHRVSFSLVLGPRGPRAVDVRILK